MNRHEALRDSSFNLATSLDLIRRVFVACGSGSITSPVKIVTNFKNMEALGLNYAELARACAVKSPTSCNWAHGKTKSIKGGPFLRAAKALGVKPEWLAIGKGPMSDDPTSTKTEKTTNVLKAALRDWRMHASPRSIHSLTG